MDLWSKQLWPPSPTYYNPLDYFMWSVVEREVNKYPHTVGNILASLKAILDVMANIDREIVILPVRGSGLMLRLLWRPVGI
jgi:hypothetical protein